MPRPASASRIPHALFCPISLTSTPTLACNFSYLPPLHGFHFPFACDPQLPVNGVCAVLARSRCVPLFLPRCLFALLQAVLHRLFADRELTANCPTLTFCPTVSHHPESLCDTPRRRVERVRCRHRILAQAQWGPPHPPPPSTSRSRPPMPLPTPSLAAASYYG